MKIDLGNKVALVTGSTRGIGKAIAVALLESGASVCVNGRTRQPVDSLASEMKKKGLKAMGFVGDATREEDVRRMVKKIIEELGHVDILVNNVGGADIALIEEISPDEWDEVIDSNLKSAFLVSREIVPVMKKRKSGRIINISSTTGMRGKVGGTHYAAAKSALIGFTKALAQELGPFNITVNAVAPGFTDTDLTRRVYFDNKLYPANMAELIAKNTPLRRIAKPQDIAGAVLFFVSPLADFVTGQVLSVDGGNLL